MIQHLPQTTNKVIDVLRNMKESAILPEQIREMDGEFIRPNGLEKPCVPAVISAVEELAALEPGKEA